jgi:hypothetical protein
LKPRFSIKILKLKDRERVLARRRKFESSQTVKAEKKVISLKSQEPPPEVTANAANPRVSGMKKVKRLTSEEGGDSISLSVDDTLVSARRPSGLILEAQ